MKTVIEEHKSTNVPQNSGPCLPRNWFALLLWKLFKSISYFNILKFVFSLFYHLWQRLDMKAKFTILQMQETINGKKIITILKLPNILRIKGNQTVKFDQLIESNLRINYILLHKSCKNKVERLVSDLLLFFTKALYEIKDKRKWPVQ